MAKEKNFEQSMEALETIVTKLESGSIPLSDMVALYEQGSEIGKRCAAMLDAYQARLDTLGAPQEENA